MKNLLALPVLLVLLLPACVGEPPPYQDEDGPGTSNLSVGQKQPRYQHIRDAARARGIPNTGFLLAGIANDETGLAMCWSEATWACQGPSSPACGGGPVIAGSADGPCGNQQGGLGMFQFDAGTYQQTLNAYGNGILTVDGQVSSAIDYITNMVKISVYTTNAETDAKARAWIANFNVNDPVLRDQWIKTVVRYYNGCQPGWSCWSPRYQTYSQGLQLAIDEPGGLGFWASGSGGTSCGGSPATVGAIDAKYKALGGCGSFLGVPITAEIATPDGAGRYSVFERGSIYWTATIGAHEVHGVIRDKWKETGWEAGALGYPVSDEYDVAGGRRSDFEHGSIIWNAASGVASVDTAPPGPHWKVLDIDYQKQDTGYWCGPAATRIALSARIAPPSQSALASQLGTTTNGTDWIGQITTTLNARLGASRYITVEMPNDPPTQGQRDRLWNDVVMSIDNNYPVVANIVAPPSNHPPGYPNSTIYHYFAVIGYNPDTREVFIADSAFFGGNDLYWLTFDQLATLIPPKGYSTYACPTGLTSGAIHAKYQALGGCGSVIGGAMTAELTTPDGTGRYNVFERGSIYWTSATGAHEVHGRIRDKWKETGWEAGALGYPVSDEYAVPGGRQSDFEHGSIKWTAANDTTSVSMMP